MPSILPLKETKGPDRIRTVSPNLKLLLVGSFLKILVHLLTQISNRSARRRRVAGVLAAKISSRSIRCCGWVSFSQLVFATELFSSMTFEVTVISICFGIDQRISRVDLIDRKLQRLQDHISLTMWNLAYNFIVPINSSSAF